MVLPVTIITTVIVTADYLVGAVSDKIPDGIIPIIVFLISMLVAFSTGTSWGTMAIVIPLAVLRKKTGRIIVF
jgi:Na+/H+ antiporter NhaC